MRTEVGYAGGRSVDPTYRNLGGHAEVLNVTFSPGTLPLELLLDRFWAAHDPASPRRGSQYRAVLLAGEHQRQAVEASAARVHQRLGQPPQTEIAYGAPFYPAEAYHQKWYLRREQDLFDDLRRAYPDETSMLASTAAARVNGYLRGNGPPAQLDADIERLGLSPPGQRRLRLLFERYLALLA